MKVAAVQVLQKLWWGQYSLPKAFWGFYVLGFLLAPIIIMLLTVPFFLLNLKPIGYMIQAVGTAVYWLIATVGVWQSANAYPYSKWWPNMAKCVVMLLSAPYRAPKVSLPRSRLMRMPASRPSCSSDSAKVSTPNSTK